MSQQPTVGRIVHYQPLNSPLPLAAIITGIEEDDFVNLSVFMPDGTLKPQRNVAHTNTPHEGCWNWPPRT